MLKKLSYALVLTGLVSGQAFALNNPGFEDGLGANPAGWVTPVGTLTAVADGTNVKVIDDVSTAALFANPAEIYNVNVEAMSGKNFGLLETCPAGIPAASCADSASFSFSLGGPVSNYGDVLWMRLFTADFVAVGETSTNYNDSVSVSYFGTGSGSALQVDSISVQSMYTEGLNTDSGWKGFAVPIGTNSIMVQLNNVATVAAFQNDKLYNRPIVALDYDAVVVTPVPEADVTAMMLAGLGALGLVSRRRAKRAD